MNGPIRSAERALAFDSLVKKRPDLAPGQVALLVDLAARLVGDGERALAVDLLGVVLPGDKAEPRRIADILVYGVRR